VAAAVGLGAALAGGLAVLVAPPAAADTPPGPQLAVERYQLPNGLTVLLHPDHRLPLVAVSVWYDVGGLHERPGRTGFAHLFEHMMFQGSAHVPEDQHFPILQRVGATDVNGTTDFDRTNYFETVPRNQLETALWLESDRMGFLLARLTAESLANQIDVVKNERGQSVDNTPYGSFEEKLTQAMWPKPHPYYGNVIGSLEDLSAATLDDVKDFWLTYYTPANATLAIGGDFDEATIKALVAKYFGSIRGRPRPPPPAFGLAKLDAPVTIEHAETVGRLAKLSLVWAAEPAFGADNAALDLLGYALSGTRSARLTQRLVHELELAQSVSARLQEYKAGSPFTIDVLVRPGRAVEDVLREVDAVLASLATKPITADELARAKNAVESKTLFGLEPLGGMGGRVETLQTYQLLLGDPDKLAWDLARYRAVDTAAIAAVAARRLGPNRIVGIARPAAPQGAAK
jgi:predicted Zn-dependent peptidase